MIAAELAQREMAKLAAEKQRNRERFPAAKIVDVLRAAGFEHASVAWASNAAGEEIGARDPGPWIDAARVIAAAEWNRNVLKRGKLVDVPRQRTMTQSQRECLEGI